MCGDNTHRHRTEVLLLLLLLVPCVKQYGSLHSLTVAPLQIADAFIALDINGDGRVSMRELKAGIALMDWAGDLSPEEIKEVMTDADVDHNGYIDLNEFIRCFGPHPLSKEEVRLGLRDLSLAADGRRPAYLGFKLNEAFINDIEILASYQHMQFVDISRNEITDLSPLGKLDNLVKLNASHNRLESVLDFRAAEHLTVADLSHNRIVVMNDCSPHRSLQSLDLQSNQIKVMDGLMHNMNLKRLLLDNNGILQIMNVYGLPLQHLSMRNNRLSAINGHNIVTSAELAVLQRVLEANFDSVDEAFMSLDANEDGSMSRKEFLEGLRSMNLSAASSTGDGMFSGLGAPQEPEEFMVWFYAKVTELLVAMDVNKDGRVDLKEFGSIFGRSEDDRGDSGIKTLALLEHIDLSGNPITSLKGLEGHPRLRAIKMGNTAVTEVGELKHIAYLGMLEELDLEGAPISTPSSSPSYAACFRIQAIHRLLPSQGKTKLSILNGLQVVAEERVSAANFHDENHLQYMDHKRDDSQDIPAKMYQ